MAEWNTETTKASFDVTESFRTMESNRGLGDVNTGGNFTLDTGGNEFDKGGLFSSASGYDLVGIKASKVDAMRESIREYVKEVDNVLEGTLEPSMDKARYAFRGSDALDAVNAYILKVKEHCKNITSTLLAFSDLLAQVGNAWDAHQLNIANTVNESSSSLDNSKAYVDDMTFTPHSAGSDK